MRKFHIPFRSDHMTCQSSPRFESSASCLQSRIASRFAAGEYLGSSSRIYLVSFERPLPEYSQPTSTFTQHSFHVFQQLLYIHQSRYTISKVHPCKKSDIACSRRHSSWRPCNLLIACRGFQRAAISCMSRILNSWASCVGKTQLPPSADSAGFFKPCN